MAFTKITNAGFGLTTGTLVGVAASFSSTVSVGGTLTYEDVTNVDSVGLITARNGIEVTDKGIQVGTGATVDSAAANTLTFLTGGSEALRIDSSGNFGLGTSSPSAQFVVSNSGAQGIEAGYSGGTSTNFIQAYNRSTSAFIQFDVVGNPLVFKSGSSATEAMRINSSGNVGIKTSSPVADLDVNGRIASVSGSSGTPSFHCRTDTNTGINLPESDRIQFITAGSEAARIDSSGNFGLGITSPITPLHIKGGFPTATIERNTGASGAASLGLTNSTNSGFLVTGSDTVFTITASTGVTSGTGLSERLRIDSSGNFGLGTSSPQRLEHLSTSTDTQLRVESTSASSNNEAAVELIRGSNQSAIKNKAGGLEFFTGGLTSERMRITSDGQLLVGTSSSPAGVGGYGRLSPLVVQGYTGASTSGGYMSLQRGETASNTSSGDEIGILSFNESAGFTFGQIRCHADGTPGSSDYPGRLSFFTTSAGASSPTERMLINSSGQLLLGLTSATSVLGNGVGIKSNAVGNAFNKGALVLTGTGGDFYGLTFSKTGSNTAEGFGFLNVFSSTINRLQIGYNNGSSNTSIITFQQNGDVNVVGAFSKGSGSFRIDHPLPAKTETHDLVHSFIEGPQADLIYRGKVDLVAGAATVNLDTAARMTEGTFVLLNTNVQCFTTNESDWIAVRGSVSGNTLTIAAEENTSTATVSWLVIGERQDQHILDTDWTDDNGRVITEPEKAS